MNLEEKNPFIFIISGKARHGKDTVASMIRNAYEKIGLNTINLQYSTPIKEYAKKISNWDGSDETKPRELLQLLGTELIRQKIDFLFFVFVHNGSLSFFFIFNSFFNRNSNRFMKRNINLFYIVEKTPTSYEYLIICYHL